MSQKNENFIDKTFTIIADVLLKTFPASKQEKQAFFYYREGLPIEIIYLIQNGHQIQNGRHIAPKH